MSERIIKVNRMIECFGPEEWIKKMRDSSLVTQKRYFTPGNNHLIKETYYYEYESSEDVIKEEIENLKKRGLTT